MRWWIHLSPVEAVSLMISESAAAQFFLTISESKGVVCSHESRRHLWKMFCWRFPSRHRLSFHSHFLSQKGLRALPNARFTFERCFREDFWVGSDSVCVDYFLVNRGCWSWRIHAPPLESVLLMISKSVVAWFSCTVSMSTGAASADESTHHLWKRFGWRFLSLQ